MPIGMSALYDDVLLLDGVRTPWTDLNGALGQVSPTDLGIAVARALLARGHEAGAVDSVLAGSVAQASFDAYLLPRHIGLYAGVPEAVPALQVQRVCGTGLELLRQAGDQLQSGQASRVLCVAAESMTRNPIAAYTHRSGFRLGAPVEFHDFLWEALKDPAAGLDMIATAERLAQRHGIAREAVDAWALRSFERALAAQRQGWFREEVVPVTAARFAAEGLAPRELRLPRGCAGVEQDSHPRETSREALARLTPVHPGGVQTAGNSCAVADGAAALLLARGADAAPERALAWVRGSCVVGVPPDVMGSGPVPAIQGLLDRAGLRLEAIDRLEINEAQGAQLLAVQQALELDPARLNVHGGAIALGHPLAATGLRLAITLARQLRAEGLRYGVAAVCIGGGQGMAVLLENPGWRGR